MKKYSAKNKVLWGLVLAILLTGCGLKANPVPLVSVGQQNLVAQELTASADGNSVVLTWTLPDSAVKISYIDVERSRLGSSGNVCKDCPRQFDKVGQLIIDDSKKSEYRFVDALVEKGQTYSYRLKLCDENSVCNESQTVETDFK
ncbi:MAG: hypothetical protein ACYDGO_12120 [Smithellaceae bacterium]